MRPCLYCSDWGNRLICRDCQTLFRSAQSSTLVSGLQVFSGLVHETVARRLVHLLKYQALRPAATALATAMTRVLPGDVTTLVPVPRATLRRIRYGCDPAVTLAQEVSAVTGVPVVRSLRPELWWPAHAGRRRLARRVPGFRMVRPVVDGSVLVDDVLTTGATLDAASEITGLRRALTATAAGREAAR